MNYLFDTNILLLYMRPSDLKEKVEQMLNLQDKMDTLIVSVVSVGEIKSLAIQNKWGERRLEKLEALLQKILIADIRINSILQRYAEIDAFSQGKLSTLKANFTARNMGKNDLWIAATASVLNIPLLTTDNDFDHLNDVYLSLQKIDLKTLIQ